VADGAITGAGEDGFVVDYDRTDRDFTGSGGGAGFLEGQLHKVEVFGHGGEEGERLTQSPARKDTTRTEAC